jgi:NTP pyrophosphatase (non-canonical NTP hydrolase)
MQGRRFLEELQGLVGEWSRRNFGDQPSYRPLLGVGEEVGELDHAHLKGEQGIRHSPEEIQAMKVDAIGDIVIYLADYCEREGISLSAAVEKTWETVMQRDWKKNAMGPKPGDVAMCQGRKVRETAVYRCQKPKGHEGPCFAYRANDPNECAKRISPNIDLWCRLRKGHPGECSILQPMRAEDVKEAVEAGGPVDLGLSKHACRCQLAHEGECPPW